MSSEADIAAARERARRDRKRNKKAFAKWRTRPPKDLDAQFQAAHEEAFSEIDCLKCANCCKTTSPIFRDIDIDRLARHLSVRPAELVDEHLRLDGEGDYVLRTAPCPFLGQDNYCSVYEARPKACREYPHTDRKRMVQILPLTLRNTTVCPAVERIVDRVVKNLSSR